jgi:hypothetical protein
MFSLIPLLGGVIAGRYLKRTAAITAEALLYAVAMVVLIATAPHHTHHVNYWALIPLGIVVGGLSAASLALGLRLRLRRSRAISV